MRTNINIPSQQFYDSPLQLMDGALTSARHVQHRASSPVEYAQLHNVYQEEKNIPIEPQTEGHQSYYQTSNCMGQQNENMHGLRNHQNYFKDQNNYLSYGHSQAHSIPLQQGQHQQQQQQQFQMNHLTQQQYMKKDYLAGYSHHQDQYINNYPSSQVNLIQRNPSLERNIQLYSQYIDNQASLPQLQQQQQQHPSETQMESMCLLEKNESGIYEKSTANMSYSGQFSLKNNPNQYENNPPETSCFQALPCSSRKEGEEEEPLRVINFDEKLKNFYPCQEEGNKLHFGGSFYQGGQHTQEYNNVRQIYQENRGPNSSEGAIRCGSFQKQQTISASNQNESLSLLNQQDPSRISECQTPCLNGAYIQDAQGQSSETTIQMNTPPPYRNAVLHQNQEIIKSRNTQTALLPNCSAEESHMKRFSSLPTQWQTILPQQQFAGQIPCTNLDKQQWMYHQQNQYHQGIENSTTIGRNHPLITPATNPDVSRSYQDTPLMYQQSPADQSSVYMRTRISHKNQIDQGFQLNPLDLPIEPSSLQQNDLHRVNHASSSVIPVDTQYRQESSSQWNKTYTDSQGQQFQGANQNEFHAFEEQVQYHPTSAIQSQVIPFSNQIGNPTTHGIIQEQVYHFNTNKIQPSFSYTAKIILDENDIRQDNIPSEHEKQEEIEGERDNNPSNLEPQKDELSSNKQIIIPQNLLPQESRLRDGSFENTSNLTAEQQECVNELQHHKKKNVAKNIMTAFKNFMTNPTKFGYSQEQIEMALCEYNLTKKTDETLEEMQGKFVKYILKKKFNHYTIKLLIQHPNYGMVFEYFLKSLSEFWLDQSKVHDLRAHLAMITFLKQAFTDIEIISELKKYDKRKH